MLKTDLYFISTGRPQHREDLTNDIFDNLYPFFIPNTKRIVICLKQTKRFFINGI